MAVKEVDNPYDETEYIRCAEILKALGNATRLRIVEYLINSEDQESSVMDMINALNIPQATASQHLKILKFSDVVEGERHGTSIIYKIKGPSVKTLVNVIFQNLLKL